MLFPPEGMAKSVSELSKLCRKDYYHPFQRNMHYLMLYVTRPLLKTRITPNQITIFWLILQLIGALFMIKGTYVYNLIGVILYTLATLFDYIDGQIARIKKISTYKGIFLEELGIYFGSSIFMLFFSLGVAAQYKNNYYFILGIISTLAIIYSKLAVVNPSSYSRFQQEKLLTVRNKVSTRSNNKSLAFLVLIFRRSNPFNFLFFGIILDISNLVLIIYTVIYILEFLRRMVQQLNGLHKLDQENSQTN